MIRYKIAHVIGFVSCIATFTACAQDTKVYTSPQGYDLTQPETFYLSDALHEISGIVFPFKGSDKIAAVEDETGTVYQFRPGDKDISPGKFGKSGDYEGIASSEQYMIVLTSDGSLSTFPLANMNDNATIPGVTKTKDLIPDDEYEGLAVDPASQAIYVLCKECKVDKKTDFVTGYVFDLQNDKPVLRESFQIDSKQINSIQNLKGKDFKPSALAKNTQTNEWYILSSVNKMLVIADSDWGIKDVYVLNTKDFNQPEGIAFDSDNNLYISNEGGDKTKKGTILKFNFSR